MMRTSLFVGLLLTTAAGCASQARDAMRTRFSREYSCAEQQVQVTELGGNAYQTTGCDRTVTYVCNTGRYTSDNDLICVKEGTEPPK